MCWNHDDVSASATVALAAGTGGLLVATGFLSRHTKQLASLTKELVRIENQRELREARDRRNEGLEAAIQAARQVQDINASSLADEIDLGGLALLETYGRPDTVRQLAHFSEYLGEYDPECVSELRWICTQMDAHERRDSRMGDTRFEFIKRFTVLRDQRLPEVVRKWGEELRGVRKGGEAHG